MYALGRIETPFSYYKPPRMGGAHCDMSFRLTTNQSII